MPRPARAGSPNPGTPCTWKLRPCRACLWYAACRAVSAWAPGAYTRPQPAQRLHAQSFCGTHGRATQPAPRQTCKRSQQLHLAKVQVQLAEGPSGGSHSRCRLLGRLGLRAARREAQLGALAASPEALGAVLAGPSLRRWIASLGPPAQQPARQLLALHAGCSSCSHLARAGLFQAAQAPHACRAAWPIRPVAARAAAHRSQSIGGGLFGNRRDRMPGERGILLPQPVLRGIGDKLYDKRKSAALEVEQLMKALAAQVGLLAACLWGSPAAQLAQRHTALRACRGLAPLQGNTERMERIVQQLIADYAFSSQANCRKGGLLCLAAAAVALAEQNKVCLPLGPLHATCVHGQPLR